MFGKYRSSQKVLKSRTPVAASPFEPLESRLMFSAYTVTTLGDGSGTVASAGPGKFNATTLRAAIHAANAHAGADSIQFAVTGTINLNSLLPAIDDTLTLAGPGASKLTVQRGTAATKDFSIFAINPGKTATLSGLTISKGTGTVEPDRRYGAIAYGGGIFNQGNLTLLGCTVSGNKVMQKAFYGIGGGIYDEGRLTVLGCQITGNAADYMGGGIVSSYDAHASIANSTVSGNTYYNIENIGSKLTVSNSTISDSTSFQGIDNNRGTLIVTDCTLSGNAGGAIRNSGTLVVTNSTISGNRDLGGADPSGNVGGILNEAQSTATVSECTITNNVGAGLYDDVYGFDVSADGQLTVVNSIVAGNRLGSQNPDDIGGPVTSTSAYNLIGTGGSGGLVNGKNGNKVGVPFAALKLGPLGNNGGPTKTQIPLTGSPALGAGSVALIAKGIATDQRGLARVVNGKVDIGAVEVQVGAATPE